MNPHVLTRNAVLLLILIFAVLRLFEVSVPRPAYSTVYFERGARAEQQNQPAKAVKFYKKAVHYNPENPLAYEGLGRIAQGREQTQEMVGYYQKAADSRSSNWEVYYELGTFFFQQKDFSRAGEFFLKAAELNRKNAQINFQLGLAYEEQGAYGKAIDSFRTAISNRHPAVELVRYHLGISYYKMDDLIDAKEQINFLKNLEAHNLIKDLQEAIGWQDPQWHYRLGVQYCQRGDVPGAKDEVNYLAKMNETALAQKLQDLVDALESASPQQVP